MGARKGQTSVENAVVSVLKSSGRPMTCSEICQAVLKIVHLDGKTPYYTCYSFLYRSEKIKKVGKALFELAKQK